MGLISPTQVSDGTTIDASDVNNPINTIANEFNGNIDNANIKSAAAIDGSKIADNTIDIGGKASTWDGWIEVSDSWSYASASTITVPSDATAKYDVGDKIKLTNSTVKYFQITAVASTTLTVVGVSGEVVANSAISSIYYSKSNSPHGFTAPFNPYKFSVYRNGNQTISTGSYQKIQWNAERFDTNSNFDSSTNYRYTAPVNGFYWLSATAGSNGTGLCIIAIYKNGTIVTAGSQNSIAASTPRSIVTGLFEATANDYFEVYMYSDNNTVVGGSADFSSFSGFLVSRA